MHKKNYRPRHNFSERNYFLVLTRSKLRQLQANLLREKFFSRENPRTQDFIRRDFGFLGKSHAIFQRNSRDVSSQQIFRSVLDSGEIRAREFHTVFWADFSQNLRDLLTRFSLCVKTRFFSVSQAREKSIFRHFMTEIFRDESLNF